MCYHALPAFRGFQPSHHRLHKFRYIYIYIDSIYLHIYLYIYIYNYSYIPCTSSLPKDLAEPSSAPQVSLYIYTYNIYLYIFIYKGTYRCVTMHFQPSEGSNRDIIGSTSFASRITRSRQANSSAFSCDTIPACEAQHRHTLVKGALQLN